MGSTEVVVAVNPLTVQERIKRSQDLAKQSTDQLAASKGLVTAPVTAVGTGAIGGTPQQQAMAGTPAQKQGALAAAVAAPAGETGLEQAMKVKPQAAIDTAKAKEMDRFSASLGTFGDKVNQWIEGVLATTTAADTGLKAKLEFVEQAAETVDAAIKGLPADKQGPAKAAMDLLKTQGSAGNEKGMQDAVFQLNALLGRTTTEALLTKAGYGDLWKAIDESTAGQLETAVQTKATGATDLNNDGVIDAEEIKKAKLTLSDITSLGSTPEEISALLNIPVEQVQELTLGEFQQQLQRVGQQQFGETQQVAANIASALVSETEREALRGTMRELEESGIAGVEAQFQQLINDIEQGAVITIGGQTYNIEEFIAEGTISTIAEQYYKGDKKLAERLAAEEPQLKAWLDSNRAALISLIEVGGGKAEELKGHNQKLDETRELLDAFPDLRKRLNLEDDQYKTGNVMMVGTEPDWSVAGSSLVGILKLPSHQINTALTNLDAGLTAIDNAFGDKDLNGDGKINKKDRQIAQKERETLKNSNPELFLDGNLMGQYQGNLVKFAENQTIINNSENPIDIINVATLNDVTMEDVEKALADDEFLLGIGMEPSAWYQYDLDHDGTINVEEARQIAKASIAPPTLEGTKTGKKYSDNNDLPKGPPVESGDVQILRNYNEDGQVTAEEILADYTSQPSRITLDGLLSLYQTLGRPGPDDSSTVKRAVFAAYSKARDIEVTKEYDAMGYGPNGLPAGATETAVSILQNFNAGAPINGDQFRTVKAVIEKSIQDITRRKDRMKNPDMAWKMDQDLAGLMSLLQQLQAIPEPAKGIVSKEESTKNKVETAMENTPVGQYVETFYTTPGYTETFYKKPMKKLGL